MLWGGPGPVFTWHRSCWRGHPGSAGAGCAAALSAGTCEHRPSHAAGGEPRRARYRSQNAGLGAPVVNNGHFSPPCSISRAPCGMERKPGRQGSAGNRAPVSACNAAVSTPPVLLAQPGSRCRCCVRFTRELTRIKGFISVTAASSPRGRGRGGEGKRRHLAGGRAAARRTRGPDAAFSARARRRRRRRCAGAERSARARPALFSQAQRRARRLRRSAPRRWVRNRAGGRPREAGRSRPRPSSAPGAGGALAPRPAARAGLVGPSSA